jgi:sn-1 stearoyl-lipid 9-desaturase
MESALAKPFAVFPTLALIAAVHVVAIAGAFLYPPDAVLLLLLVAVYVITGSAMTLVFHRCLCHRAFAFRWKWVERVYATIASLQLKRGPIWWCRIHRMHHRHSDTELDPHNSRAGFWSSHVLWLGRFGDWGAPSADEDIVKDIAADPYYRLLDRFHFVPGLVLWSLLWCVGGWAWVIWGGLIPTVLGWHAAFAVNSLAHGRGYRNYDTRDTSTNNWWIALLAFGEGWHNNHHAFPASAKHGFFRWWELDSTYLLIRFLQGIGLVHRLRLPSSRRIDLITRPYHPVILSPSSGEI